MAQPVQNCGEIKNGGFLSIRRVVEADCGRSGSDIMNNITNIMSLKLSFTMYLHKRTNFIFGTLIEQLFEHIGQYFGIDVLHQDRGIGRCWSRILDNERPKYDF